MKNIKAIFKRNEKFEKFDKDDHAPTLDYLKDSKKRQDAHAQLPDKMQEITKGINLIETLKKNENLKSNADIKKLIEKGDDIKYWFKKNERYLGLPAGTYSTMANDYTSARNDWERVKGFRSDHTATAAGLSMSSIFGGVAFESQSPNNDIENLTLSVIDNTLIFLNKADQILKEVDQKYHKPKDVQEQKKYLEQEISQNYNKIHKIGENLLSYKESLSLQQTRRCIIIFEETKAIADYLKNDTSHKYLQKALNRLNTYHDELNQIFQQQNPFE